VVADSADDAMEPLAPGDVLVVRATSPAFNLVLSIAGALVTVDGSQIEVDPAAGTVRVIGNRP
jgi:phosphohistidine swiveling domain-containing protein